MNVVMMKIQRRRRRGFTLIEVLLVMAILVALAALVVPRLLGTQEGAQIDNAKLQVTQFDGEAFRYKMDTGVFPTTEQGLKALAAVPNPPPQNWRGPYSANAERLDPWGNPYNYQFPGARNGDPKKPDIWSNGPDRANGSPDDIGNWTTPSTR